MRFGGEHRASGGHVAAGDREVPSGGTSEQARRPGRHLAAFSVGGADWPVTPTVSADPADRSSSVVIRPFGQNCYTGVRFSDTRILTSGRSALPSASVSPTA